MRNIALFVALVACAPKAPPAPAAEPAPAEAAPEAAVERLPPVFDAAALRAGFRQGTVLRYKFDDNGAVRVEEWVVTATDDAGCTIHTKVFAADGVTVVDESDDTETWENLAAHGTFPAAQTTRADGTVDVGAGHLTTWYYEVAPAHAEDFSSKYHFSPAHVGPPVWAEFRGGDGYVVTMELLSRTDP